MLCIDDLQWSDTTSLRFVAYLTRRIAELPVLVATTIRTGEPDADELLLGEIGQDPATVAVAAEAADRPTARSGSSATLLGDADGAFAAACQEVTAGNPLLLRQLLTAVAAEQRAPDAGTPHPSRDRPARGRRARSCCGSPGCPRPRRPSPARSPCSASRPGCPRSPALAETDEDAGRARRSRRWCAPRSCAPTSRCFVHPLVRDAVYLELPAARRGLEHARAARLLAELGASPERIAAQLMLAPPRADAWVVERLREAAAIAIERGAPDAALAHLQRAQAEPPAPRAALGADARARRGGGVRARHGGGRGAGAGARRAHRPGGARRWRR